MRGRPYDLHLPDKRNGKIAHLPRDLRDRICQCIYDGASLTKLAEALNHMPEVKSVLANHFEGHPLNKQNLSEWKAGGYRDWLLKRQLLQQKGETVADAQQLAETANGLADSLFGMLTLDYAQIMMNRDKIDDKAFEKPKAPASPRLDYAGKKTSDIIAEIEEDYARKKAARLSPPSNNQPSPSTPQPRPNPLDSFSDPVDAPPRLPPHVHNPLKYYGPCPAPGRDDCSWSKLHFA
jgi:hypothetical protein